MPTSSPPATRLNPRQELFAYHVAHGASLAQAARLAGYSAQGARQRGSLLMSYSDVRVRVEEIRRAWMAERHRHVSDAVEHIGQAIDKALRLDRPSALIKAVELQLKLRGIIQDPRFSLYNPTPDDDLTTAMFDPSEEDDLRADCRDPSLPDDSQLELPLEPSDLAEPPETAAPELPPMLAVARKAAASQPANPVSPLTSTERDSAADAHSVLTPAPRAAPPASIPAPLPPPPRPVLRMPPPPPGLVQALNDYKKLLKAAPPGPLPPKR